MDVRSLSPQQLHDLDLATGGEMITALREAMILGPYLDADVSVDFAGAGYVIDLVFGCGRDGCLGRMTRLVIEDGHALPEIVRLGLMLLQIECFQRAIRDRRRRSDLRVAKILEERSAKHGR